LIDLDIAL